MSLSKTKHKAYISNCNSLLIAFSPLMVPPGKMACASFAPVICALPRLYMLIGGALCAQPLCHVSMMLCAVMPRKHDAQCGYAT